MVLLTVGWRPVYLVPSRYVAVRGKLLEAEERMRYAVALAGPASRQPMYLRTLLAYAPIRQAFGDRAGARALFGEACALIDG